MESDVVEIHDHIGIDIEVGEVIREINAQFRPKAFLHFIACCSVHIGVNLKVDAVGDKRFDQFDFLSHPEVYVEVGFVVGDFHFQQIHHTGVIAIHDTGDIRPIVKNAIHDDFGLRSE